MQPPELMYAETQSHYMARQPDPQVAEAERLIATVNEFKAVSPSYGQNVQERLVDDLVKQLASMASLPENAPEPAEWTAPQRHTWRSANHLSLDQRMAVINDRRINKSTVAFAVVDGGRWLVKCPFPTCNGAQYASYLDRRFYCVDCDNKATGGQWIAVTWPSDCTTIEKALTARPGNAQHWLPGETAGDLHAQDRDAYAKHVSIDPTTWTKTETLPMRGETRTVNVLHYGTPEWNKAQKVGQ